MENNSTNDVIMENVDFSKINNETALGIAYSLKLLYGKLIDDPNYNYDLLRLGAVKLSEMVFRKLSENTPDNIDAASFISNLK